jgi:DNA repair protein RadC
MQERPYKPIAAKGIKTWAVDDRPREKLITKSHRVLSNAELLAIVIGSGSGDQTAVELSKTILNSVSNNLAELATMSIAELMKFKGIGEAKASNIVAVMELGRRRRLAGEQKNNRIISSRDAFEIILPIIGDLKHEELWIITLKNGNNFHRTLCVSEGGIGNTVADPKKIFRLALENNAAGILICHNHPSGNPKPSNCDIQLTIRCVEAGKSINMPVMDHIIVANDTYFSFGDQGML